MLSSASLDVKGISLFVYWLVKKVLLLCGVCHIRWISILRKLRYTTVQKDGYAATSWCFFLALPLRIDSAKYICMFFFIERLSFQLILNLVYALNK